MKNHLCPGCTEEVRLSDRRSKTVEDAAGRPWHERCSLKALADHFRTPLTDIEVRAAVSFECEGEWFDAPHSFHLREIVLPEGAEVQGVFIGQKMVVYAQQVSIRACDLPERTLVIDHDVPRALSVCVTGVGNYRLVGERRPEQARPRPSSRQVLGVGLLRCDHKIASSDTVEMQFAMPVEFRGERLVVDDWEDWEVASVKVGRDSGRAVREPVVLSGLSTDLPTYIAKCGEQVVYEMKNIGSEARPFLGRVYGEVTW